MKVVVVYESMYGNTHLIADAIGRGIGDAADVVVVPVGEAVGSLVESADLLVVGGPTHVHGMSRTSTREAAVAAGRQPASDLTIDPAAERAGLRDWLSSIGSTAAKAAAFDTRLKAPAAVTGRASKRIAKELRSHGCTLVAEPESFLVTKGDRLLPDEETRARDWGATLVGRLTASNAPS